MNIFISSVLEGIELNESIELNPIELTSIVEEYNSQSTISDPLIILYIGLFVSILCGIAFAYLMQGKLKRWENDKTSPLPLANNNTLATWIGFFVGLTLIFTGALQIFDFTFINSFAFALLVSIVFGYSMWQAINDLMKQVATGNIKEIDDFF